MVQTLKLSQNKFPFIQLPLQKATSTVMKEQCLYYNKAPETPSPTYGGLTLHAQTRKSERVDTIFKLGWSISSVNVLAISTPAWQTVHADTEDENVICPLNHHGGHFHYLICATAFQS